MEGQPMTAPATEAEPGQTPSALATPAGGVVGAPAETPGVMHAVPLGVTPLPAVGGEMPAGAPRGIRTGVLPGAQEGNPALGAAPAGSLSGVPTPPPAPPAPPPAPVPAPVPATVGSPVPAGPPHPPPLGVDQAQPMPAPTGDPTAFPTPPPPRTEFPQVQEQQQQQPAQVPLQTQAPQAPMQAAQVQETAPVQDADMGSLASNLAQLEALQKEGAAQQLGTVPGRDAWSLPQPQHHETMPAAQASPALPLVAQITACEAASGVATGLPPVPAPPVAVLQTGEGTPVPPPPAPLPPPPPAAPPEVKELETDAPADDERPKLQEQVCFLAKDTTLNLVPSVHGNVLMPLTDGGVQYLLAGARGNTGVISGRYMFEAKIVEVLNPHDPTAQKGAGRPPVPRQVLRIGFATEDATLFLGENTESLCFDSEGGYTYAGHTSYVSERFFQYQVVSVVLNLDADSPNANSVSLFRDGLRASPPQPIPDSMRGKPLFPAVTFRLQTVHVNFGPVPLAKMPFVCRSIQDAAVADVKVTTPQLPKDGKFDVLFPVFIPDEGSFDWLDLFLEKHPEYTELSDRKILEWAEKSGIWRPKGYGWKSCNDKPEFNFGLPQMDDFSVRRALSTFASVQQRHFIIMEVCRNLIKEDRKELLKRFTGSHFRKIAQIFVGEPTRDFKEKIHSILLKEKQEVANKEFRDKQAEELRRRLADKAQKELERARRREERAQKKAAAALQKAAEEAARKAEEEQKPQDGAAEGQESAGQKDAPMGVEKKGEEEDEEEPEEEEDDDKMEDITDAKPPPIQLTDDEKKQWFRKTAVPDVMPPVLATSFAKFSMPMKEDGFDDVRYEWHKKVKCAEYVREWILNKKLTTRIEDLQPSEWFEQQWRGWQQQLHKWHLKKNEFDLNKKLAEARRRQQRDMTQAPRIEQKEETKQEGEEPAPPSEGQQDGTIAVQNEAGKKNGQADKENQENKEAAKPKEDDEDDDMDDEDEDVFAIVDVCDVGKGEPLFAQFSWEDWALLSIRYELYLLVHAFRRDVNDAERVGIHTDHVLFYYNRYFQKAFNCKYFGVETVEELVGFITDTVTVSPRSSVLEVHISDELDSYDLFLKLTEECRRERNLRIDSGNDSVVLKFNQQALTAQPPNQAQAFLHNTASTGGLRPYQRGARPPTAGRGYSGPPPQKQWYGSYSGSVGGGGYAGGAGGAYSGAVGGYSGNAGRAYSSSPPPSYGQKRPYLGGESGKGKYSRMA